MTEHNSVPIKIYFQNRPQATFGPQASLSILHLADQISSQFLLSRSLTIDSAKEFTNCEHWH